MNNDVLWRNALLTSHSVMSRIVIINLLHEARGLDTYHLTKAKLLKHNDVASMVILENNFQEEILHVAFGVKWFRYLCRREILAAVSGGIEIKDNEEDYTKQVFQMEVQKYYKRKLRGPFNEQARTGAGLLAEWYLPLSDVSPCASETDTSTS